jgi:hypothetical protein
MRIAYIVSAHKLPEQLIRLVRRLHTERASFFIHVDRKTSADVFAKMTAGLRGLTNVHFVKRHACFWGEPSVLEASLEGFRALFASGVAFDRVVLLSGQCYPLCSHERLESYLESQGDKQFIAYTDFREIPPDGGWKQSGPARVDNWHWRLWKMNFVVPGSLMSNSVNRYCRSKYKWMPAVSAVWSAMMKLVPIRRKYPPGLQPFYYGSAFGCFTREFAQYIHSLLTTRHAFFRFFQYVDLADEMFYQSVAMSSPFKDQVVNDNLFLIDWENPNPQVPRTFVTEDLDRVIHSGKLFARKFDMTRDAVILDRLDELASDTPIVPLPPVKEGWRAGLVQGV